MKFNGWAAVLVLCLATFAVGACSSQEPAVANEPVPESNVAPVAEESISSNSVEPAAQSIAGQLQTIDPAAGTMVVKDAAGNNWTFSYTESTEIVGAAGVQGLSGQRGNNVIVNYRNQDDRWMAMHIEIVAR